MGQNPQIRHRVDLMDAGEEIRGSKNLALLYEGVFTVIVRIQAHRQQASQAETFRERIKASLADVEREGASAGYTIRDIRDTHFAVVAYLDSVVLHSSDGIRSEWERRTLQEELFGQTDAGVAFFEKLDEFKSREDSAPLADVLEVYLLCLLLGFEGRYSGRLRGELDSIVEKLRRRINSIRGGDNPISPSKVLPPASNSPTLEMPPRFDRFGILALAAASLAVLLFLLFKLNLIWMADQVRSRFS
jgi:type VI secretion system protein ImpK